MALKRLALVLGFVALLLSVLVLGVTTGWLSTGILAAVAALLLGAACTFRSKDIFATFIDKQVVKLGGAGDAFLARLPAFLPAWAVVAGRPAAPALASPALPAAGAQAPGCYGK